MHKMKKRKEYPRIKGGLTMEGPRYQTFSEMEDAIRTYEQLHKTYKKYVYFLLYERFEANAFEPYIIARRRKFYREIKRLERDVPEP